MPKRKTKLEGTQVQEIRAKAAAQTHSQPELSRIYGVSLNTIQRIVARTSWQWLPDVSADMSEQAIRESEERLMKMLGEAEAKRLRDRRGELMLEQLTEEKDDEERGSES